MLRRGYLGSAIALALPWLWVNPGCDPAEVVAPPETTTSVGGGVPYDGGNGDADPDAAGGTGPYPDAGTSPVLLGLEPNPQGSGGEGPTAADRLEARLTTYAVGVRSVVVARPWSSVEAPLVTDLATEIAEYRSRDLEVVLNLLVVDRTVDHRPASLSGVDWNDPQAVSALEATLDALLGTLREDLRALIFGRDVDVYHEAHASDGAALGELLEAGIQHARSSGVAPLPCGVGLSFVGDAPNDDYRQLLGLGQLAVWSYQPGLGDEQLPTDTSTTKDLDQMIELADQRPIVLLAAGHTSNASLGGTNESQQQFFDSLFGALAARRGHFDVVNVHELHDRSPMMCAALAARRGEPPDGPFADYACTSGLKDPDGVAKPAWSSFVQGAAAFASP